MAAYRRRRSDGFASVDHPAALERACRALSPRKLRDLFDRRIKVIPQIAFGAEGGTFLELMKIGSEVVVIASGTRLRLDGDHAET
jgi:hypothetical protein